MQRDDLNALHGHPISAERPDVGRGWRAATESSATRARETLRLADRIDLESVRLLSAVCESGSIARAADIETLTPSAISKRLKDLEELFGMPLLVRRREGVLPTAAGRIVAGVWSEIEPILSAVRQRVKAVEAPADDSVTIVCDTRVARFVAVDRLGRTAAREVAGRVRLLEVSAARLADSMGEFDADIGVLQDGNDETAAEACPSGYRSARVVLPAAVCVVRDDHPLSGRPEVGNRDIAPFPVVVAAETGIRGEALHLDRAAGVFMIETAPWSRTLSDALEQLDTHEGQHVLLAPPLISERLYRFPRLRSIRCTASWSMLRLVVLRRERERGSVDDVIRAALGA